MKDNKKRSTIFVVATVLLLLFAVVPDVAAAKQTQFINCHNPGYYDCGWVKFHVTYTNSTGTYNLRNAVVLIGYQGGGNASEGVTNSNGNVKLTAFVNTRPVIVEIACLGSIPHCNHVGGTHQCEYFGDLNSSQIPDAVNETTHFDLNFEGC